MLIEVLKVHPAMYTAAVQRYEMTYVLHTKPVGLIGRIIAKIHHRFFGVAPTTWISSMPNPHFGKFKISEDPSLKVNQYRMIDGFVGTWPDSFCSMPS
jgi:hypothetical protein